MNLTPKQKAEFVENNLGLVHACAHRFKGKGIEYEDLYGAGCVGLVKAVDGFDQTRGLKFSTYGVPVILGEMRRLFRDGGAVKISRSLKELSLKATRAREQFAIAHGREPSIEQLARLLGVSTEQTVEAVSAAACPLSLTICDEEGGSNELDIRVEPPEEQISDLLALKEVLATLEPKDRQLIMLRYFGGKTQTQTAQQLDMSQVQVSRREKKILQSLRAQLLA